MEEKLRKISRFSIASFLLSIVFFVPLTEILAIFFGIVALVKIHKFRDVLKGEAIAAFGIILGTIRFLFSVILLFVLFAVAPYLKAGFFEVRQNVKIARVHIDFMRIEQLIDEYYQKYKQIPADLFVFEESGLVRTLPQDPFSENRQSYKYKAKGEAVKLYPEADFLIYSVGPDGDDDLAQKQYSTEDRDGDIIKVGRLKSGHKR